MNTTKKLECGVSLISGKAENSSYTAYIIESSADQNLLLNLDLELLEDYSIFLEPEYREILKELYGDRTVIGIESITTDSEWWQGASAIKFLMEEYSNQNAILAYISRTLDKDGKFEKLLSFIEGFEDFAQTGILIKCL